MSKKKDPVVKRRDAAICRAYIRGKGLRDLAKAYSLSYERTRQIVNIGAPGKMRAPYYYERS